MPPRRLATAASIKGSGEGEGRDGDQRFSWIFFHPSELVADSILNYLKEQRMIDRLAKKPAEAGQFAVHFRASMDFAKSLVFSLATFATAYENDKETTKMIIRYGIMRCGFDFGPLEGEKAQTALQIAESDPAKAARFYGPITKQDVALYTNEGFCLKPVYREAGFDTGVRKEDCPLIRSGNLLRAGVTPLPGYRPS